MTKKLVLLAVAAGLALAVVPWLFPAGDASLSADALLGSGQLAVASGVIFLAGLLTSLTPCVYPLIPITVGVFGATKAQGRGRAVLLTSLYVVGMGVVFALLGVFAALTGKAFGTVLGDWRVALGLAGFMLILAASMFGAFELALPPALAQRLSGVGGAGYAGAFLMGSVSGFLAAPCTGPALSGVLAFVAQSQRPVLGGALLFVYALGIGVPFFLIGVFTLRLPRGGEWMEWVKSIFGIALVAMALMYLKDGIPPARQALARAGEALGAAPGAWISGALAAAGILLGAVHLSFKAGGAQTALKGVAVLLVAGAGLLRMGALSAPEVGELWVHAGLLERPAPRDFEWQVKFPGAHAELAHFEAELAKAKAAGKPVMIDFFAEWCAACKELDRHTYPAPEVMAEASRFTSIKVDGTHDHDDVEALYQRFGVQGLPTVAFVSSSGEVLEAPRITGFVGPEKFLVELKKVR